MGTEHIYFDDHQGIRGHIALSTIDAKFKFDGKPVRMYFHNYLGPSFYIIENGEEVDFYPGEEPEYEDLWNQFNGWWESKGKTLYR